MRRRNPLHPDFGMSTIYAVESKKHKFGFSCSKNMQQIGGDLPIEEDADVQSLRSGRSNFGGALWNVKKRETLRPRNDSLSDLFRSGMGVSDERQPLNSLKHSKSVRLLGFNKIQVRRRQRSTASD